MVAKLSVSLSEELTAVLDELARRRGDDRSPLIETLLRENPIVQEGVALWRKEAWTRPAPLPDLPTGSKSLVVPRYATLLQAIAKYPGVSLGELTQKTSLRSVIVRQQVQILSAKGFIERMHRGPHTFYQLTPAGVKEAERLALPP